MSRITFLLLALVAMNQTISAQEDKFQWLEEVDGENPMLWVNEQNILTVDELSQQKDYQTIYEKSLEIYNSAEKIAYPSIRGKYVYNFWKDKNHVRGIWRRALITDYNAKTPKWETVIDIDALALQDNRKWVFKGASGLYPNYNKFLIELSDGGADAVIVREFDAVKKQFIENGFYIDESKGDASYVDENTLIVSTDFGKGTMTTSGYPRQVKLWKRGTLLKDAKLIFEGEETDVSVSGSILRDGATSYIYINRGVTFFTSQKMIYTDNKIIKLDVPEDCSPNGILKNQALVQLKSNWTVDGKTYSSGSLISLNFTALLQGKKDIQVIVEPDALSSIAGISTTKNNLLINMMTNVTSTLFLYKFSTNKWTNQKVNAPQFGSISIISSDDFSDKYYFSFENFITPSTLYSAENATFTALKSLPAFFDASKYEVNQYKVAAKDGTLVPYFVVSAKNMKKDGGNPTLVYAYGGFEVSLDPWYAASFGTNWLDKGGVFVLANIRGGGEFGPKWHQDGMKEKRQNVFDDLFAVSEDVITKKITTSRHLGVMGGSNGGLLVGVAFTQRPELFNAVVCQVPLLDMQRYNKLLAGASWMGEYGNPDIPEEWAYIKKYSPYHNLKADVNYPEVFFTTSTRDDRVHPGHARKMVAKMNDLGYKVYYYENIEGGHAGSSTNEQSAKSQALTFSYLLMKLR